MSVKSPLAIGTNFWSLSNKVLDYVTHVSPTLLINADVSSDNLKFQVQQTTGIRKFKTASECS